MTAHKHAHLMAQYAQDALETDRPWDRWQISASGNKWGPLFEHPRWVSDWGYRRKPRTMTYTITIPEPLRKAPAMGSWYWLAETASDDFTSRVEWSGDSTDSRWLKLGLCFATKEDAIAAAKAMLPIKGEEA